MKNKFLVSRKRNGTKYTAKMHRESKKFELCTGELLSQKHFNKLFNIDRYLTDLEFEYLTLRYEGNAKVKHSSNGLPCYKNPVNHFVVRLHPEDPRTLTWERL